ncbi:hypothetical protein J7643_06535 [bacterium]|nr:hypothetical protein [bacterium]
MPVAVSSGHWVQANAAIFFFGGMMVLFSALVFGLVVWTALQYRAPLHEGEFVASEPEESKRPGPEQAPPQSP